MAFECQSGQLRAPVNISPSHALPFLITLEVREEGHHPLPPPIPSSLLTFHPSAAPARPGAANDHVISRHKPPGLPGLGSHAACLPLPPGRGRRVKGGGSHFTSSPSDFSPPLPSPLCSVKPKPGCLDSGRVHRTLPSGQPGCLTGEQRGSWSDPYPHERSIECSWFGSHSFPGPGDQLGRR